ncbi:MAG: xanthine dehydrogenase subunit XdhB [Lachnospiraceae bacterium]
MYDIKSITEPNTIKEVFADLHNTPGSKIICGGTDVLVKIREGKLTGSSLVSIQGISELKGVCLESDGTIIIRPATTFSGLTQNPTIRKHIPALGEAVDQAGGPQLRNVGTIGGNICNGATSADSASTLLTLNAQLEITSAEGVRYTPLEKFYQGPGKVHLEYGELLTAIRIFKKDYEGYSGHYIKYAMRNAMDIATLGCAVHLKLTADKNHIQSLRLAYGVASPTPMRCYKTEALAEGAILDDDLLEKIARSALTEVRPRTSWRATKEFREQLVKELSKRAITISAEIAGGVKDENY